MPNVRMAMDARHRLAMLAGAVLAGTVLAGWQHVMNKVSMTMQTGMLRHQAIARLDTQRIGIVVQGER